LRKNSSDRAGPQSVATSGLALNALPKKEPDYIVSGARVIGSMMLVAAIFILALLLMVGIT